MIKLDAGQAQPLSPDMTPMIDVVFIIIVFLLCVANAPMLALDVQVPEPSRNEAPANTMAVVLSLSPQAPFWQINEQPFASFEQFEQQLRRRVQGATAVQLAAAKDLDVEALAKVLALLNELQIRDTQLLLQAS